MCILTKQLNRNMFSVVFTQSQNFKSHWYSVPVTQVFVETTTLSKGNECECCMGQCPEQR